ncbi:hypothetical protein B0H63DRAFT_506554 [Podospora didyma]|uniref:Uncharacterized protein n=1 Tax=Podospora didyma TaxID=330526 RepID=A0AAE0U8Y2_9PEZI|nr:hypothetical protein B0H63DRAFT_506554 [Podospora didyma]
MPVMWLPALSSLALLGDVIWLLVGGESRCMSGQTPPLIFRALCHMFTSGLLNHTGTGVLLPALDAAAGFMRGTPSVPKKWAVVTCHDPDSPTLGEQFEMAGLLSASGIETRDHAFWRSSAN